jgi:hypothetical protein
MSRPVVVISGRHRPHEVLFSAVALIVGAAYTFGAPPAASVAALLHGWQLHVWSVGFAVSGVVSLGGILWSPRVEQAGMLIGTGALVWYAAAVAPFGWRALLAGLIAAAWAGANVWRAMQIRRDLKGGR